MSHKTRFCHQGAALDDANLSDLIKDLKAAIDEAESRRVTGIQSDTALQIAERAEFMVIALVRVLKARGIDVLK